MTETTPPAPGPDPTTPGAVLEPPAPARGLGRNYLKLWTSSAISNAGDGVRLTALPLMAATITRDPGLVAGIALAGGLPWALFALPAGALVDRMDRRKIMWTANLLRGALMTGLAMAILAGSEQIWLLYVISFFLGVAEVMFDNAAQAIMPNVVDRTQLEKANGRLYAAELVANQFVGPPLGGFLFVAVVAAPFFFDAVTFFVSALLILAMTGSYRVAKETTASTTLRAEIAEGLRWLWGHRLIRAMAISVGVSNLMHTATYSIFVLYCIEILHLDELGYAVMITTMAIGSLAASFVTERIVAAIRSGPALFLSVLLTGVAYVVTGLTSSAILVGMMGFVIGFVIVVWNVITVSLRQQVVPERILGRVNSVYRLLAWGTMPIGAAVGGVIASVYGLRATYFVGAVIFAALSLYVLRNASTSTIDEARAAAG